MAGTLGVALSTMYFGLSRSLKDMFIARAICGIFGGTMSVVHSVVGEITDGERDKFASIYFCFTDPCQPRTKQQLSQSMV
jgi:MFS family permease